MNFGKIAILSLLAAAAFGSAFGLVFRKSAGTGARREENNKQERVGLKLEPPILDLGTITVNRETGFAARIHNYGQQSIKLARVEKSCGNCTSVFVAKKICQPGEDVELKGTYLPRKPGRFRQLVKVIEDDESVPVHILEVVGEAVACIRAFPESFLLNPSVFENKTAEQVVIIRNNSDERAIVREPMGLPEGFSVTITKGEIGPKQETKVVVRAEPRFFLDTDLNLSFPTSHSIQDSVSVAIQLRPENGFTIVPSKIHLGVVSKKELEKSSVRLSLIGPGVKNVVTNRVLAPSFLKLAKENKQKGDRLEMEFAFIKPLQEMSIHEAIRIDLDVSARGSEQKRTVGVTVPISGLVCD